MSAAIEALLVFEEVQPLAFGDIMDALKDLQPTLSQALRSVTGFLQINGSFLNTFKVPWPAELRSLLATFGALNLDFVDPDAASRWLGRSMHYGTTPLSNPNPSPSPFPNPALILTLTLALALTQTPTLIPILSLTLTLTPTLTLALALSRHGHARAMLRLPLPSAGHLRLASLGHRAARAPPRRRVECRT